MWEPSQATLDKDINSWCCMRLRVLRLFGVRQHLRPSVRPLWWKGYRPRVRSRSESPKVPSVQKLSLQVFQAADAVGPTAPPASAGRQMAVPDQPPVAPPISVYANLPYGLWHVSAFVCATSVSYCGSR